MTDQPLFDSNALAAQVTAAAVEAATRIADERTQAANEAQAARLNQAADILSGNNRQSDEGEQILKGFVADPVKFARTISDATEQRIMKQLKGHKDAEELQRSIVMPFVDQHPELKAPGKVALIEKLTEKHEAAGMPYAEALKKGCEDTIKEFGLKPISEAQRTNAALYAGLPGGGGMGSGASVRNEEQSSQDFISGLRSKMSSFRVKK